MKASEMNSRFEPVRIVREGSGHYPLNEWVYNDPDIDASKVVWAREMDAADNRELMHYYPDRTVWLVEPDTTPATLVPYTAVAELGP